MSATYPRDGRGSRGYESPYYYNNLQQQQFDQQQPSDYPDSVTPRGSGDPRNSIFQRNLAANVFSQRTGRLYRPSPSPQQAGYSPLSPSQYGDNNYPQITYPGPGLENPFVLAILIAGMAGITLIIIVMVSIWILRSSAQKKKRAALIRKTRSSYQPTQQGDDVEPGTPGTNTVLPTDLKKSKQDPQTDMISELKETQAAGRRKDKFSFFKASPKTKKGGNVLSKKPKDDTVIENKSAAAAASPEPDKSVPVLTSDVSGTIIAYEKAVGKDGGPGPVRILKETFV